MINEKLLCVNNLFASLGDRIIINNFNLDIYPGEIHVIVGPNGVGKSTLARTLAGFHDGYNFSGSVLFNDCDLFSLSQSDIALMGLFLSFQNPIEIPGVTNVHFFKSFLNFKRKHIGLDPIEHEEFLLEVKSYMKQLNMREDLLNRFVNVDFSGGEKKKNEILQMLLLKPKLVILDEIDSGLDVDALRDVFGCLKMFHTKENAILMITHYRRVLDYINVDFVHVMRDGTIVKTGKKDLLNEVDQHGYINYN